MESIYSSFERAKNAGFASRFYTRLFETEPMAKALFRKTDFETQHDLLVHGVYAMLDYAKGSVLGRLALERLGRSHGPGGLAIPPAMFRIWLRCLLATVAELDPAYDAELEAEWKSALTPAVNLLRGYAQG